MRVERLFDRANQIEFQRLFAAREFGAFGNADAVFRADAAAHAGNDVMHHAIDVGGCARRRVGDFAAWHKSVVMQIAVTEMAEANHTRTRKSRFQRGTGRADKRGNFADSD